MKRQLVALFAFVALSSMGLHAATDGEARTTQAGVFSEAQSERGAALFEQTCLACHQIEEFSTGYMEAWEGSTASDFMELIRTTMPQDNPGRLKREEYIDIVAYMFHMSGLPTGEEEMDPDTAKEIRIQGPFGE